MKDINYTCIRIHYISIYYILFIIYIFSQVFFDKVGLVLHVWH